MIIVGPGSGNNLLQRETKQEQNRGIDAVDNILDIESAVSAFDSQYLRLSVIRCSPRVSCMHRLHSPHCHRFM